MKIVCDACQAKYSISDDKVQGKVFKIRCKKCSNIIVVRGGAGAAEPAPAPTQEKETRVYDYGYEGGDQRTRRRRVGLARRDQPGSGRPDDGRRGPAAVRRAARSTARPTPGAKASPTGCRSSQVDTFAAFVASGSTTAARHRRWRWRERGRRDVRRWWRRDSAPCAAIRAICSPRRRRDARARRGRWRRSVRQQAGGAASQAAAEAANAEAARRAQRELGAVLAQQPRAARE